MNFFFFSWNCKKFFLEIIGEFEKVTDRVPESWVLEVYHAHENKWVKGIFPLHPDFFLQLFFPKQTPVGWEILFIPYNSWSMCRNNVSMQLMWTHA